MPLASIESGALALRHSLRIAPELTCTPHVLAAGPGRQVIDYQFASRRPPCQRLVGKFYSDDSGEQTYRVMQELVTQLALRPAALLAVPAPLLYDRSHRMLALAHIGGESLADLARSPRMRASLRLVGQALAELHQLPPPDGPARGLADHLADLVHPQPYAIAELYPQLAERASQLWQALCAAEAPYQPALVHRDLHLRQLFQWQERIWLIDWDVCAVADPALDLGNFCAYLHTKLGPQARPAVNAFLDGYAAHGSPACLVRMPLFGAFSYLRLACKAYRLGNSALAASLIERGWQWLG